MYVFKYLFKWLCKAYLHMILSSHKYRYVRTNAYLFLTIIFTEQILDCVCSMCCVFTNVCNRMALTLMYHENVLISNAILLGIARLQMLYQFMMRLIFTELILFLI